MQCETCLLCQVHYQISLHARQVLEHVFKAIGEHEDLPVYFRQLQ